MQIMVVYRAQEAEILDTWHAIGMRGTGSHDVVAKSIRSHPAQRDPGAAREPAKGFEGPLYRLTIWTAIAALAAPALGIARTAIDALINLGRKKTPNYTQTTLRNRPGVQSQIAQAQALLGAARAYLHDSLRQAWESAVQGQLISREQKMNVQLATSFAMQASAQAVDLSIRLREPALSGLSNRSRGTSVTYTSSPQHAFASISRYQSVGKLLLESTRTGRSSISDISPQENFRSVGA